MGLRHFALQPLWKLVLTPLFLAGLRVDLHLTCILLIKLFDYSFLFSQVSPGEPKRAGKLTITAQPSERAEILTRLAQLSKRADIPFTT